MNVETMLTILLFGFGLIVPWGIALVTRARTAEEGASVAIGWTATTYSLLTYVLAFNLTFFIQEVFLVLPKAMVPGLDPILYHNNHNWTGEAAIADLFQGTGALAILVSGLIFSLVAARQARPSLFVLWMAFHGLFQSLPQFVVGAITAGNDVGQAYDYLQLGVAGEIGLALVALIAMPIAGILLGRRFLATAWDNRQVDTVRGRHGFLVRFAGVPALAAIPIIILFRIPREAIEVLLPPILVPLLGFAWLQLAAVRPGARVPVQRVSPTGIGPWLATCVLLLAFFQMLLRPGIAF